jgi:aryl-alcohol dehydrogenase-like predicted oxidoreductase
VRTRPLGDSGIDVSAVGLGCNNFGSRVDAAGTKAVVDAALDAGVTFFDTADVYGNRGGSETFLGDALKGRRDRVVLATKFGHPMSDDAPAARGARAYVREAVEASLRRLQTDWIDLYQYHRPDGITPVEETLGALDELVGEGKLRAVGSSNFSAAQVVEADRLANERGWTRFVTAQNEYSLLEREAERELLPTCERLAVGVLPYFPLASGLLTGKYRRGAGAPEGTRLHGREERLTDDVFDRVEALERYASARGRTVLEVAIAGLLAQTAIVSVIAGATKEEQVRANAAASEWQPSADDLEELGRALDGVRV